jgi:hypothetical protein
MGARKTRLLLVIKQHVLDLFVRPVQSVGSSSQYLVMWVTRNPQHKRPQNNSALHDEPLEVLTHITPLLGSGPKRTVIVLVGCPSTHLREKLVQYYQTSDPFHERWSRLENDEIWLHMDLYFLFTKWDRVWAAVKKHLKTKVTVRL